MPVPRRSSRQRTAPANQLAGAGTIRRRHDGRGSCRGFTLPEVLLAVAITTIVLGMSVPMTASALDEIRTSMAARYIEGRIMNARMLAVKRSASVALRFEAGGGEYGFAEYLDGNGNGIRSAEITAGVDPQLAPRQLLRDQFPLVVFGLRAGIPDVDGLRSTAEGDGIRIGTSRILAMG